MWKYSITSLKTKSPAKFRPDHHQRVGSALRDAGTKMLISSFGPFIGAFGGGILEARVLILAKERIGDSLLFGRICQTSSRLSKLSNKGRVAWRCYLPQSPYNSAYAFPCTRLEPLKDPSVSGRSGKVTLILSTGFASAVSFSADFL
jgi:hypothetical protein